MRIRMIIAMAGAAGLFLTGTANAYPIKDPVLTKNAFYTSGKLAQTRCAEPPIKNNDRTLARRYMAAVTNCLNTAWGAHFKAAGLPFGKPRLKFVNKVPAGYCGLNVDPKEKSQVYYCRESRTMVVQIGQNWLTSADDLWLLHVTGLLYGAHLAGLTGIEKAFDEAPYANRNEMNEQIRRSSLQTDCLGGVFTRSVWSSFGRGAKDWNELLRTLRDSGDVKGQARTAGTGANRAAWTKLGYATGDPASCNTWTATPARVA
ncbi:neutral zinc metallopeptidase [Streptosporangium sp. NBC_01469]|uniref:neutral zinc metallopeptidase n=1 Tax=Streptosporangium sp. NBC_01469 TaxID=2903898 RepID=UPI002E2A9F4B|nr:neutral zinc metallopeptidase [Streptosporangium sp. NBC_01469]